MKKLLGIVVLGLLWCNVGVAEERVYYCVDQHIAGFIDSSLDKMDGKIVRFEPQKFKIKIDNSSTMIAIKNGYDTEFKTRNQFHYNNGFDETIVFIPENQEENPNLAKHYVRSHTLPGDSLYVATGRCEKF